MYIIFYLCLLIFRCKAPSVPTETMAEREGTTGPMRWSRYVHAAVLQYDIVCNSQCTFTCTVCNVQYMYIVYYV